MKNFREIDVDLTDYNVDVIAQQCNCVCIRPAGLAQIIADKYSWGNVYGRRKSIGRKNLATKESRDKPGTIIIQSPPKKEKGPDIAFIFSQWNVSKPITKDEKPRYNFNDPDIYLYDDTLENRELWLKQGLDALGKWCMNNNKKSVAFPHNMGCNLGGGIWSHNLAIIKEFAKNYPSIAVTVCKYG
jgi:hypothetical protein